VLPCIFDNFVWFSSDELDRALRARVPFYDGTVPERGTVKEQTSAALQSLLQSNGFSGTVDSIAFSERIGGPINALSFRVNGISIPVRTIHFPGASAVSDSELGAGAAEIIGKDYSASDVGLVASVSLVAMYHRKGYLRAHFDPPQAKIDSAGQAASSVPVTVVMPVTEGPQFRWDGATWAGNKQFSSADLGSLLAMRPQEIANQEKIDAGLVAVTSAYAKQGFIDLTIRPQVSLDAATQRVTYRILVDEGVQFRMGQVHFRGLPDKLTAEFAKKWQLQSGQIYDGTYAMEFMKKIVYPKLAEMRPPATASIRIERDTANATVDLLFAFQ
jgi:outer membrane protein assembly factor BamA